MREIIKLVAFEVAVASQDTKSFRGFDVGSGVRVRADAQLSNSILEWQTLSCVIGPFAGSALPSVNVCNCRHKKAS